MRKHNYDTLKRLLIILVVFAHMLVIYEYCPNDNYKMIINLIYCIHMPLFFMITGHSSKKIKK